MSIHPIISPVVSMTNETGEKTYIIYIGVDEKESYISIIP